MSELATSGSSVSHLGLAYRVLNWATASSGPVSLCDHHWRLDGLSVVIGICIGLVIYAVVEAVVTARWAVVHWVATSAPQHFEVKRPKELYKIL